MSEYPVDLTRAHLLRHAPSAQSLGAAIIDAAQDLLLRDLSEAGLMDLLVFKGGTALRKFYAGAQGRFSVDLDFALASTEDDPDSVVKDLAEHIDGLQLGPFTLGTRERRGKKHLIIASPFGDPALTAKIDVSPPAWLEPVHRTWVPMQIHTRYGGPLPQVRCVRLEENIAEKIARLNRTTTARDIYDLVWLWRNYRSHGSGFDTDLVRRLAVLKIWVDTNGMHGHGAHWPAGHEGSTFSPHVWLRVRTEQEFDRQDIGLLSAPPPRLADLAADLRAGYAFMADLLPDEIEVAASRATDRSLVLAMISDLPTSRLVPGSLW